MKAILLRIAMIRSARMSLAMKVSRTRAEAMYPVISVVITRPVSFRSRHIDTLRLGGCDRRHSPACPRRPLRHDNKIEVGQRQSRAQRGELGCGISADAVIVVVQRPMDAVVDDAVVRIERSRADHELAVRDVAETERAREDRLIQQD